jgi:drug/metabolite transporter (DMT)-like permease
MVAIMEPSAASTRQRVLAGILFMCGAGLLFPVMNGAAKFLGEDGYDSLQVSWARSFGHIIFMLAVFLPKFGFGMLRTHRPVIQLTRSAMLFTSNATNFLAIIFIPMAKTAALSLTAPAMVVVLAWAMLGERTTRGRLVALAVGFAGVLIVIRPGTELFHWASLLSLGSAVCYAFYQVLTRKLAGIDSPETSTVYSSILGAFGMLLVLPFIWRTPETLRDILYFCSLGVIGAVGHYMVARAFTNAPANIISPFQYVQLIGSVVVGYVFFGEFPDVLTWIGAAIIVASGVYIGWSQARPVR